MTTDDVILLIKSQWERGLIIPDIISRDCELVKSLDKAAQDGLCVLQRYHVSTGMGIAYVLTKEGYLRFGELTDSTIVFV